MNETDPKSEAGYSAAQRLLDEAVDQAVREEYPAAPPILVRKNAPPVVPEPTDDEY